MKRFADYRDFSGVELRVGRVRLRLLRLPIDCRSPRLFHRSKGDRCNLASTRRNLQG